MIKKKNAEMKNHMTISIAAEKALDRIQISKKPGTS
jgi:hypothetical protein